MDPGNSAAEGWNPSASADNSGFADHQDTRRRTAPAVVATYLYDDEDGNVIFRVERLEPGRNGRQKEFRQSHPDGRGGWIYNMEGVGRLPYRAGALRRAVFNDEVIYLVEGEKDADNLLARGLNATCVAGGAGAWKDFYGEWFSDADVVVLPDNDEPGRRFAADAIKDIRQFACRIRLLELPGLEEKGDVSDWMSAGHTIAELEALVAETAPLEEALAPTSLAVEALGDRAAKLLRDFVPLDWEEFWKADAPPIQWLIEPVVPAGRQVAVFSPPKQGKSLFVLDAAAAAATGRSVLGNPATEPITVLYLDFEMTEEDVRERLLDLGYGPEDDLSRLVYYQLPALPPLDSPLGGETLEALVVNHNASLVVVDTMSRVTAGEENDSDTYRNFYNQSGVRLKRLGVALLRLDHAGKDPGKGQRGSSAKADDVDVVFQLAVLDGEVVLKRTHSRVPWVPEQVVMRREADPLLRHVIQDGGWPSGTLDAAEMLEQLGVPIDATVNTAAAALRLAGKGKRRQLVAAAQKFRQRRGGSAVAGTGPLGNLSEPVGTGDEMSVKPQVEAGSAVPGTVGNRGTGPVPVGSLSKREPTGRTGPDMRNLFGEDDIPSLNVAS